MTTKKKGIFITFEGISATIFDSQIALHSKELNEHAIIIDIIAFETWPGLHKKSRLRLNQAKEISQSIIYLHRGMFVYLPCSEIINSLLLLFHVIRYKEKPEFIHARTDYVASICLLVSFFYKIPIIWDCRGDTYAEFNTSFQPKNVAQRIFKYIFLKHIKIHTYIAAKISSKAIFVSEYLQKRKGKYLNDKPFEIIPTTASASNFYYSEELRKTTRDILGFKTSQKVIIYSGAMTGYQNFKEYVSIFGKLYEDNSNLHFLVITPDLNKAGILLQNLDQKCYTLKSSSFNEMNSLYNASDFGILIREKNEINDVASPTKFSEYCLAGLPIIMNDSIKQSYKYALEFGNLIAFDQYFANSKLRKFDLDSRNQISLKAAKILSRESNINKYLKLYKY